MPAGFILVAYVNDDGRLHEIRVPREHAHIVRERGWMVFDDFEPQTSPQADGDDGA
jgi:hypothetical protein